MTTFSQKITNTIHSMMNVRQRKDDFDQSFLHTVTAVPDKRAPQQIADETIYHRQK